MERSYRLVLSEELYSQAKSAAKRKGMTLAAFIRNAISTSLSEETRPNGIRYVSGSVDGYFIMPASQVPDELAKRAIRFEGEQ